MPPITPPAIAALPDPPSRADPANFPARGDAFLGALPAFRAQANALGDNAYANALSAAGSATAAETARGLAQDAQGAAQLAAQQAVVGAGAALWVFGATYSPGDVAVSPARGWTYRRRGAAGVSTVDPAVDTTNWALAAPADLPVITVGSASVTMSPGARYSLLGSAATTATLPASPLHGDMVAVVASNLRRDNVVARNGQLIEGLAEDLTLNRLGAAIGLAFVGGARGWAIVRFDTLDRSFPLPIDGASGALVADVANRMAPVSSLLALGGAAGQLTVPDDLQGLVLHNGVPGQAKLFRPSPWTLVYRGRYNDAFSVSNNIATPLDNWTGVYVAPGYTESGFGSFIASSQPRVDYRRLRLRIGVRWDDAAASAGIRELLFYPGNNLQAAVGYSGTNEVVARVTPVSGNRSQTFWDWEFETPGFNNSIAPSFRVRQSSGGAINALPMFMELYAQYST